MKEVSCSGHGGSSGGVHQAQCRATFEKSAASGTLDFNTFDAARVWIDLSESNLVAKSYVATSINIVLRRHGAIVASANFPATQQQYEVRFDNPPAVNSWLRGQNGMADEVAGDVASVGFFSKSGTNLVTFKIVYDGVVDVGGSRSWYSGAGDGGCDGCALE
ncbi:MAG: hypothetical protein IT478_13235 [Xanthomonadales bacterium]|nr:hypothetical protein [Xanthomonadales bacterium]